MTLIKMMKNRRGTVTVLICLFFASMMILVSAYINAAKAAALSGNVKSLGLLWGESVLAEYDLNLYHRYGIFGFYGQPADVSRKLDFYAIRSFSGNGYADYDGSRAKLYDYALVNTDMFRKQVVSCGKTSLVKEIKPEAFVKVNPAAATRERGSLLDHLPSGGKDSSPTIADAIGILKSITSVKDIFDSASDAYFENRYIEGYFKSMTDERDLGQTYFNNEIEYIICGKYTDRENAQSVKLKIIGVREAMNLAYIMKNQAMCAQAMAAAEILTPGPAAAATQKALIAAWALAESNNDYKLLAKGYHIPAMKTESTWAIDLESIVNNTEEGMIFTGVDEGQDYNDYLKIFISLLDDNVRLLRMMDLIQINCRLMYYDGFLLRNYNGGMEYVLHVNGRDYKFKKSYETEK